MKPIFIATLMATTLSMSVHAVWAQDNNSSAEHAAHHSTSAVEQMSDGEVRRIDLDQKKITLRHGELKGLNMPPMTMVFQLKNPAWLDQLQVGDKVRFVAEQINGAYTVTRLEKVQP